MKITEGRLGARYKAESQVLHSVQSVNLGSLRAWRSGVWVQGVAYEAWRSISCVEGLCLVPHLTDLQDYKNCRWFSFPYPVPPDATWKHARLLDLCGSSSKLRFYP